MSQQSLPSQIQALVINDSKSVDPKSIEFGNTAAVRDLDPNFVIIRNRAVGLNPTDWKHAFGDWGVPGHVAGADAAGDVVQVGSAVENVKVGDRVTSFSTDHNLNGAFAEFVRFDSALLLKLPDGMSYEEGASFPIPHYTAAQALYSKLNLPLPSTTSTLTSNTKNSNQTILIWGGSTAVGHHAIQLAHTSGVRVFTTASPAAHASLKTLGADEVFDYRDPDVVKKIRDAALKHGESGLTLALDTVSEGESVEQTIDSLGPTGGKVILLLPPSPSASARRADVEVDMEVVYTLSGEDAIFGPLRFPALPSDRTHITHHLTQDLPALLEGWKRGEGSQRFKTQTLRRVEGGSWGEAIVKGMRIMQKGEYGREKLVVSFP